LESFDGLIRRIVTCFNASGIDYMFTGALAASFYGVPRATMGIDVVIRIRGVRSRGKLISALRQAELQVETRKIEAVPKERAQKDEEDVRAILKFTRVNVQTVKKQARKNSTLSVFKSITA
jgi:hypothetical protein